MDKQPMYVKLVNITPSEATKFLASKAHNRHLSKARILKMADDMTHHRWVPNGEAIKLDENGKLLDGQHRLEAAVKANFTLPTLLVSGLDPSVVESLDQGTRRTNGNVLQLMKPPVKSANNVAAVCVMLWQLDKFGQVLRSGGSRPTRAEMLAQYRRSRGVEATVAECWNIRKHVGNLTLTQLSTLHYLLMKHNPKPAIKFFAALSGEGERIPVVTLLLSRLRGHMSKRALAPMALTIKAWNAYIGGRKLGVLKWAPNESWPDIEGLTP